MMPWLIISIILWPLLGHLAFAQVEPGECVRQYAAFYRVPPEFIAAIIDVESGWNPRAVSNKGAMGLMQLMPATAQRFGARQPFATDQNIAAGTHYVAVLMAEFSGDLRLVAAAYYAGDTRIGRSQLRYHNPDVTAYVLAVRRQYMKRTHLTELSLRREHP